MYRILLLCVFLHPSSSAVVVKNNPTVKHRYFWRDFVGSVPKDAFIATDGLYVGQVLLDGVMAGGFYPNSDAVVTEYSGRKVVIKDTIKILCDRRRDNFVWERVHAYDLSPQKLKNMVIGGFEDGSITYIGRVFHEGQWKIGKVFPPPHPLEGLNIWNNYGQRYVAETFEILNYLGKENDSNSDEKLPIPKNNAGVLSNQGNWFEFPKSWFNCD